MVEYSVSLDNDNKAHPADYPHSRQSSNQWPYNQPQDKLDKIFYQDHFLPHMFRYNLDKTKYHMDVHRKVLGNHHDIPHYKDN